LVATGRHCLALRQSVILPVNIAARRLLAAARRQSDGVATVRQQTAGTVRLNALGWLRRSRAFAWIGLLALLVQVFVPPAHDAHDIAAAFATADQQSRGPAETARLALVLLEHHRHGSSTPVAAHHHDAGQHKSPGSSHQDSDDGSGGLPCPVWQAGHAASHFVAPVLPVFYRPVLLPSGPQAGQVGTLESGQSFSHPQSRAPPREV
jgi:hypothetical protein